MKFFLAALLLSCATSALAFHMNVARPLMTSSPHMATIQSMQSQQMAGALESMKASFHAALQSSSSVPQLQSIVACSNALTDLSTLISSCAADFQNVFSLSGATQANVASFCSSSCANQTEALLDSIVTACADVPEVNVYNNTGFTTLLSYTKLICTKDGATYCWPAFPSLVALASSPTQSQLETACGPCIATLAETAAAYGVGQIADALKMQAPLCTKLDGQFCVLAWAQAQTAFSQLQNPSGNLNAALDVTCSPCTSAYLVNTFQAFMNTDQASSAAMFQPMLASLRLICEKQEDGSYCYPKITSVMMSPTSALQTCPEPDAIMSGSESCPGPCSSGLADVGNQVGCCLGSVVKYMTFGIPSEDQAAAKLAVLKQFVTGSCGVKAVFECAEKMVQAKLVLGNMAWSYVQANMAKVKDAIKADLAANLAVPISAIDILSIQQGVVSLSNGARLFTNPASSVTVSASIVPPNTAEATAVNTRLNQAITGDSLQLTSVASLGPQARADPLVGIDVDSSASSAAVASNPDGPLGNGAATTAASTTLAVVASALLLALAF